MVPTAAANNPSFEVAVIGAGVVGAAIARALSHFELRTVLIEAGGDVGTGTSKANSAILHTGFDAPVGSLEARLVSRGHRLLTEYAAKTGIPLVKTGATLVAWSGDDIGSLERIRSDAAGNGVGSVRALSAGEVYTREPHLSQGVIGGVAIPDESIICPFSTPLAMATEAKINGVTLLLDSPVTRTERAPDGDWLLRAGSHQVRAGWVINAAGLHGDSVGRMFGDESFEVTPRRGQFLVFDKAAAHLVSSIVLGVPSPRSKGVLLAPTVFGNLLLGPTAEDVDAKDATETTAIGLDYLLDRGRSILPALGGMEVTSTYSGLRAVSSIGRYDIEVDAERRYGRAAGIRSTGLSASMAIAELMVDQMSDAGLRTVEKSAHETWKMPPIGEAQLRSFRDRDGIAANPKAGRVVCFCEMTTLAELEAAAISPIPPVDVDGLFRRTRATGGRCQGFYCRAEVTSWLAAELGRDPADLLRASLS